MSKNKEVASFDKLDKKKAKENQEFLFPKK